MKNISIKLKECAAHLTSETLKEMGIHNPKKTQLKLAQTLTQNLLIAVEHQLVFDKRLTKKEISCLFWAAKGKTTLEIARLLHVEISTVKTYRKRIQEKLNAKNITQAVFEGIRLGYLPAENMTTILPTFEGQTINKY